MTAGLQRSSLQRKQWWFRELVHPGEEPAIQHFRSLLAVSVSLLPLVVRELGSFPDLYAEILAYCFVAAGLSFRLPLTGLLFLSFPYAEPLVISQVVGLNISIWHVILPLAILQGLKRLGGARYAFWKEKRFSALSFSLGILSLYFLSSALVLAGEDFSSPVRFNAWFVSIAIISCSFLFYWTVAAEDKKKFGNLLGVSILLYVTIWLLGVVLLGERATHILGEFNRFSFPHENPNQMAVYLIVAGLLFFVFSGGTEQRWDTVWMPAVSACLVSGLDLTGSRIGLIAGIFVLLGFVVWNQSLWRTVTLSAVIGLSMSQLISATFRPLVSQNTAFERLFDSDSLEQDPRIGLLERSIDLAVKTSNPSESLIFGQGFRNLPEDPHFLPLTLFLEFGAVGLALFLGAALWLLYEQVQSGRNRRASLAISFFVFGFFISVAANDYVELPASLFLLGIAYARVRRRVKT